MPPKHAKWPKLAARAIQKRANSALKLPDLAKRSRNGQNEPKIHPDVRQDSYTPKRCVLTGILATFDPKSGRNDPFSTLFRLQK